MEFKILASGSAGNCCLVDDGRYKVMLDCGLPIKKINRLTSYKTHEVDACLVTHQHLDHCKAIKNISDIGIDCYALPETKEALGFTGPWIKTFKLQEQFKIGSLTVLPFPLEHFDPDGTPCPNAGFLIGSDYGGKMIYITDTSYSKYKFTGLSLIAVECNYSHEILEANIEAGIVPAIMRNRLLQSHFALKNVKEFLQETDLSRVERIYLLHLSENNGDEELFVNEIQHLTGIPAYVV